MVCTRIKKKDVRESKRGVREFVPEICISIEEGGGGKGRHLL